MPPAPRSGACVAYDAGIARVYPPRAAEVRQIHVRDGQMVAGRRAARHPVARPGPGRRRRPAHPARRPGRRAGPPARARARARRRPRLRGARQQQQPSLAAASPRSNASARIAAGQARLAEAATRRARRLAAEGAGTQRQVEDSRSALLARRAEIESAQRAADRPARDACARSTRRSPSARIEARRSAADDRRPARGARRAARRAVAARPDRADRAGRRRGRRRQRRGRPARAARPLAGHDRAARQPARSLALRAVAGGRLRPARPAGAAACSTPFPTRNTAPAAAR